MLVVADASPLVGLIKIGHVDVLAGLYGAVVIPPQVAAELADPRRPAEVRARIASALPGIVALWCAGVLVLSIRYLGGWRLVQRMDRTARPLRGGGQ